jgi:hypothetical protein
MSVTVVVIYTIAVSILLGFGVMAMRILRGLADGPDAAHG